MALLADIEIERIGRGLVERTLAKSDWTHQAHFAAALWLLRRHGPGTERVMPGLIRAYNEATGTANTHTGGYHETITLASLRAARFMLEATPHARLAEVLEAVMAREFGESGWLLAYWRRQTLFSVEARLRWMDPDLRELTF